MHKSERATARHHKNIWFSSITAAANVYLCLTLNVRADRVERVNGSVLHHTGHGAGDAVRPKGRPSVPLLPVFV